MLTPTKPTTGALGEREDPRRRLSGRRSACRRRDRRCRHQVAPGALQRRGQSRPRRRLCCRGHARAAAYAEAEQRHRDRLAAIQRHFGQQVMSRGDPNADHALAFVDTVADPRGRLLHSRKSRRSVGLSRSITTVSNARFVSTPADASRPTPSPSPGMGGRVAARSLATPKPSWRPREPALG